MGAAPFGSYRVSQDTTELRRTSAGNRLIGAAAAMAMVVAAMLLGLGLLVAMLVWWS